MVDELFAGARPLEGRTIRHLMALAMDAPAAARSGHSGTAMALAPLGVVLFGRVMRHDPTDDSWPDRDRFILSAGHVSILQYGLAHFFGYDLSARDLRAFRQLGSRTPGHPESGVAPTVEVTTGPLGQGLANGVGMALAERLLRAQYGEDLVDHRTWVVAGDGCLEEGISHEAASFAGTQGLDRLTVIYDDNHITIDGPTELALHDDTPTRFAAYGWHVVEVGERANDLDALEGALREAIAETSRPTLVVVRSHIGFPSPAMMDRREAHGSPFSAEAIAEAKAILGLPDEPFALDESLPGEWLAALGGRRGERTAWAERVGAAAERGARLLEQIDSRGAGSFTSAPERYDAGAAVATRKALQRALDTLAPQTPGISAGSADLTDNTGVVLASAVQGRADPGGRQIYFGVREFAMGAILVGQALHGGIRPIGSTFFVFSDYMRPALRLASLSGASALFVFTHDSPGVGEDGPTHQPIEHLMALRAMPELHVVRPSDANETLDLVERLLSDPAPPATALVLSRQDLPVLEGEAAEASARDAWRGGYVLREDDAADVSLLATGSEVAVALAAADRLDELAIRARVVALPCWACFAEQPVDYADAVLRRDLPSVAVEAGATLGWERYADEAVGIDRFGLSAPGAQALAQLGITVESVLERVRVVMTEFA
jgi:transketolase